MGFERLAKATTVSVETPRMHGIGATSLGGEVSSAEGSWVRNDIP